MAGLGRITIDTSQFELVARMYSLVAQVESMKADNMQREAQGLAMAWDGAMFQEIADALGELADKLHIEKDQR